MVELQLASAPATMVRNDGRYSPTTYQKPQIPHPFYLNRAANFLISPYVWALDSSRDVQELASEVT